LSGIPISQNSPLSLFSSSGFGSEGNNLFFETGSNKKSQIFHPSRGQKWAHVKRQVPDSFFLLYGAGLQIVGGQILFIEHNSRLWPMLSLFQLIKIDEFIESVVRLDGRDGKRFGILFSTFGEEMAGLETRTLPTGKRLEALNWIPSSLGSEAKGGKNGKSTAWQSTDNHAGIGLTLKSVIKKV